MKLLIAFFFLLTGTLFAQNAELMVLHDTLGTFIDSTEKAKYHLFTFWSAAQFDHAEFYRNADSTISIKGTMKDGNVYTIPCTKKEFDNYNFQVRYCAGLIPKESSENCAEYIGKAGAGLVSAVGAFFVWRKTERQ